jgi:uncharacterized protein YbaP (TraB family)
MVILSTSRKSTKSIGFRTFFVYKKVVILFILNLGLAHTTFAQSTILWKVVHQQTNKESFLLGTLHQMGNSFVDSIPIIADKLKVSEIAIFETFNHSERIKERLNSRSHNYEYKEVLKQKEIEYIQNLFDSLGVPISKLSPIEALIKMDQIYVETICGTVKPYDNWNHFDNYLVDKATQYEVELMELENDSIQLSDINSAVEKYNYADFKKALKREIKSLQKGKVNTQRCQYVWNYMNFDLDYQFNVECSKSRGLKARNDEWISVIEPILSEKSAFLVVGIMHLFGNCGLISQLRAKGYLVEPIMLD